MNMGSHYETIDASTTGAEAYYPLQQIGDDELAPGMYAIGLDLGDGGVFIVGTPEKLDEVAADLRTAANNILEYAARPLTTRDFVADEDGFYQCPRCSDDDSSFEPREYDDLHALTSAIEQHILKHRPPHERD